MFGLLSLCCARCCWSAFEFNATARTGTARFGPVDVAAGACDVAAPAAGPSGGGAVALVALADALGWRRRRGRGR